MSRVQPIRPAQRRLGIGRLPVLPVEMPGVPVVVRERLVGEVTEAAEPVRALLAPGGCGKTVLLLQVAGRLRERGRPVAWLTVTPSIMANPSGLADALARAFGTDPPSGDPLAWIARTVPCSPADFLVVDDAHLASGREGSLLFDALLGALRPDQVLLLAASGSPPFPVAKLELAGRLRSWTMHHLRCESTDVFDILQAHGVAQPSLELCSALEQHAEGWLAPIALLARDRDALARLVGAGRQVLAEGVRRYIEERFVQTLRPELRDALIGASTVDRIGASLFEALTGHSFFELDRQAIPLRPEPGDTGMFRFNRLFLRVLRERLDGVGALRRAELQCRAAIWLTEAGRLTDAASHAIESGNRDCAVEAINKGARAFIANGEISEALSWLSQFEADKLDAHPLIRLYYVTALTLSGRFAEAEAENEAIAAALARSEASPQASAEEIGNQTMFHRELIGTWRRGGIEATIEQIIERMAGRRTWIFGEAVWLHGLQLFQKGDFVGARRKLVQSEAPLMASGSWYALAVGQTTLAQLDCYAGDVTRARGRCRSLVQELTCGAGADIPATAMPALMLARLSYEAGDAPEAANQLAAARRHLAALSSPEWTVRSLLLQARMAADADCGSALEHLERAVALEDDHRIPVLAARARAALAATLAGTGRYDHALEVVAEHGLLPRTAEVRPGEEFRARWVRIAAGIRLRVASGRAHLVAGQASALVATAERAGLAPYVLEGQVTAALALVATGERTKAARLLREALLGAQRAASPRLIADLLDPALIALVREFEQSATADSGDPHLLSGDFLRVVLGGETHWRVGPASGQSHRDLFRQRSLTEKEIEVLELVEAGLSNQQIADELFISVGTVKWHVRNILNKLGAQNRTAAIRLAKSIVMSEA